MLHNTNIKEANFHWIVLLSDILVLEDKVPDLTEQCLNLRIAKMIYWPIRNQNQNYVFYK